MIRFPLLAIAMTIAAVFAPASADLPGTASLAGKQLEDAVVWLDSTAPRRPAAQGEAVLYQRDVQFQPHVLVVEVGTRVKFPNSDRVFHNVFSFHDGKKFDLGLYPVGAVKEVPFDRPGLSRVFCNIHPQMAAYVLVLDTPHFAVSDAAGRFRLKDIPQGVHPYHAWRPGGSILNGEVDTSADEPFQVNWP